MYMLRRTKGKFGMLFYFKRMNIFILKFVIGELFVREDGRKRNRIIFKISSKLLEKIYKKNKRREPNLQGLSAH